MHQRPLSVKKILHNMAYRHWSVGLRVVGRRLPRTRDDGCANVDFRRRGEPYTTIIKRSLVVRESFTHSA